MSDPLSPQPCRRTCPPPVCKWACTGSKCNLDSCRHRLGKAVLGNLCHAVPTKPLLVVLSIKLVVIESSQKINAFFHHHLDIAVLKKHPVLEGVDPGIEAVVQTFAAEGVTRDLMALFVSLVHDCRHFFRGEGGRNHHFAIVGEVKLVGSIQLDPVCPVRDLLSYSLPSCPG